MAYNPAPQAFFGPGYTLTSSEIKLKTATAAGVTTGTTFQAEADDDVLTTAAAHNLKVGDRVRVTQGTTLPTGLTGGTDYWVKTVPSTTTLTLATTKGGTTAAITADGTADNTIQGFGPLDEVTDTEANASTGDFRKVLYGVMEMIYQKWTNTPTADRPAKLSISRSSAVDDATGNITRYYSVQITTTPTGVEVTDE